jgi:hypothetical protein
LKENFNKEFVMTKAETLKAKFGSMVKELTFGYVTDIETGKPIIWGLLIPIISAIIFSSLMPFILVPGIAVLVQTSKGEEKKAAETLSWSLLVPGMSVGLLLLGAMLAVL